MAGNDPAHLRQLVVDHITRQGFYVVSEDPAVDVPRDEILKYPFVLKPLADLVPEHRHPLTRQTYSTLWAAMAKAGPVELTPVAWAPQPQAR